MYVIQGINKKDEIVYGATDWQSGGYPYWTNSLQSARFYPTIEAASKFDCVLSEVVSAAIGEVTLNIVPGSYAKAQEIIRRLAENREKIAAHEKQIKDLKSILASIK